MATSLNKWRVITSRSNPMLRTIQVPGTTRKITLRRAVAPVFAAFLADWHAEMPKRLKLTTGPVEGYNYRTSRFTSGLSNHASGTACDIKYDVLKPDNKRHMTDEEREILKRILDRYVTADGHHIFANGYSWKNCDEMHTELSQGWDVGAKRYTTFKDVKEVKRRLKIDNQGIRRA